MERSSSIDVSTSDHLVAMTTQDLPFDAITAIDEPLLLALIQHGWDLLSIINSEFDVTWASPSWLPVLGYEPDYIVRENPDLLHPDEWEQVNAGFLRMADLPDGSSSSMTFKMRRADGEYRTFEVRLTVLFNDPDVRGIVAAARDVTERDEAFETLRRSNERARSLLEQAHDLVCLIDIDGRVSYLSDSFATVLGWDVDAVTGVVPEQYIHPDDWPTLIESLGVLTEGERAEVRLRAQHRDGRWRVLDGTASNQIGRAHV